MRPFVLAGLLMTLAAPARAQSVADLRARAAAARADRPASVPEGTLTSIDYLLDVSERIERRFGSQAEAWRNRAERFLTSVEAGRDPYPHGAGQILNRGYAPSFSPSRQGYAIYLPPDYDPARAYPLMVMLHGGSSNGNLFLGVVLGNNMDWLQYNRFLYDDFTPRWSPDWIIVAPDGIGQVIWRWMGEQDVLEVIDDVVQHYHVDENRIALGGVSNGGMGAHSIGTRHAWRFSVVQAMAGAPSWIQYTGGRPRPDEMTALLRYSGMHLIENGENTDFRYYQGTEDPGPMRPAYVRALDRRVEELGVDVTGRWYQHGHDLLYLVHRHGRVFSDLAEIVRDPRPREVRLVTGDYRAARQHWVTVTRIERYPELARVRAVAEDGTLRADTDNVTQLSFDLRDAPVGPSGTITVSLDGTEVYSGPRLHLGHVVSFARDAEGAWHLGFLPAADGLEKVPGLAGPLTDAYHDEIVHVYGTQNPDAEQTLRRTAERGARGWPLGLWNLEQRVVRDTDVTPAMMRGAHLALYGAAGDNAVLDRIMASLPIRAESDAIVMANGRRFSGRRVGARFIYPNPEQPDRYVLVHTGVNAAAVSQTRNLPDFLPDYVVYDQRSTGSRPRLIARSNRQPLAAGYFDASWQLPEWHDPHARRLPEGISAERMRALALRVGAPPDFILPAPLFQQTPAPQLEPGDMPAPPARPTRFVVGRDDPNGPIARQIARLVPTFYNYRAIIPGGEWIQASRARWRVRPEADCLAALDEADVPYERVTEELGTPTPTPVEITGRVNGIDFRPVRQDRRIIVSCEMAARLPLLTRIAARQNVNRITILSAHRERPRQSFHRMGMALDIFAFDTRRGRMSVNDDFVETPASATCDAPTPSDWRARGLLRIACDLVRSRRFNSVLTPNYNDGHRNHFHIDIRPSDDRIFVR